MKYIVLPILKFIEAILLTIFYAPIIVVCQIFNAIWHWEFYEIFRCKFSYDGYIASKNISSYYNPKRHVNNTHYFKSIFHYIWGIVEI